MKCKHCKVPVVSRPMPMVPGQTKPSGVYWCHDYGGGVLSVYAIHWPADGHFASPREEPLDDMMTTDDCDGDAFCGCGRVYPHRASTKRLRRKQQERVSFPLWIFLHQTRAWERHESTTAELRDYLRAVWRSAGHATAVSR